MILLLLESFRHTCIRTGLVPCTLCIGELPQLSVCSRRTINEDDPYVRTYLCQDMAVCMYHLIRQLFTSSLEEMLAGGGRMILGSDSHTRYGALGTMAMGEGGL